MLRSFRAVMDTRVSLVVLSVALTLSAVLHAPAVVASATLDTPIATGHVEDDRGNSCDDAPMDACVYDARNVADPSNAKIDASQNTSYVGVASKQGAVPANDTF